MSELYDRYPWLSFSMRTDDLSPSISSAYRYSIDVVFMHYRIRSGSWATARGIPERKCASDFICLFFFLFGQSDGPSSNVFLFLYFLFLFVFVTCFFLLDVRDDSVSSVKIEDAITISNNNNQSKGTNLTRMDKELLLQLYSRVH